MYLHNHQIEVHLAQHRRDAARELGPVEGVVKELKEVQGANRILFLKDNG
jgi:hypothetical protein